MGDCVGGVATPRDELPLQSHGFWKEGHHKDFKTIQVLICSAPVLKYFEVEKDV